MLLILPIKLSVAYRLKEIFLHIFRPAGRIADDPVQFALAVFVMLVINVDNCILMTSGESQSIGALIVPDGVVMKPVMRILTARTSCRILRQNLFVVPFV